MVYGNTSMSSALLIGCVSLYSLIIGIRIFRGGLIAWSGGVPMIYIFFYICTLELLPVALFLTYLTSLVK